MRLMLRVDLRLWHIKTLTVAVMTLTHHEFHVPEDVEARVAEEEVILKYPIVHVDSQVLVVAKVTQASLNPSRLEEVDKAVAVQEEIKVCQDTKVLVKEVVAVIAIEKRNSKPSKK
jgi:hypothetical protein